MDYGLKKGAVKVICETQECKNMEYDMKQPTEITPIHFLAFFVTVFIIGRFFYKRRTK